MKYIIEIEDEPLARKSALHGEDAVYRAKGFKSLVFDKNGLDKLIPYTEPDHKTIEDAQEEVWEFCKMMIAMSEGDFIKAFGCSYIGNAMKQSYQEAKSKYEAWKAKPDEIHVGDEVAFKAYPDIKIYVTDVSKGDRLLGGFALVDKDDFCGFGDRYTDVHMEKCYKTGKHYPTIAELFEQMKGEADG